MIKKIFIGWALLLAIGIITGITIKNNKDRHVVATVSPTQKFCLATHEQVTQRLSSHIKSARYAKRSSDMICKLSGESPIKNVTWAFDTTRPSERIYYTARMADEPTGPILCWVDYQRPGSPVERKISKGYGLCELSINEQKG